MAGQSKIAEGKFQSTILRMVILPDRKSDIEGVAGKKGSGLQALGHVPAQSIEGYPHSPLAALIG